LATASPFSVQPTNIMADKSKVYAALPLELQDMPEGEEVEKVCKMHREGQSLCLTHADGIPITPTPQEAKEDESVENPPSNPLPEKGFGSKKPSDFMKAQPGMQKY
jgi:hypothetical protein